MRFRHWVDVGSGHKVNIGLKKLLLWVEGVEFSEIVCVEEPVKTGS